MEIWAHRGLVMDSYTNGRRHQGNTRFDFQRAYDCGVHGIETDVLLNKNGDIIVFHPGTLIPDPIGLSWLEAKKKHPDLLPLGHLLSFLESRPDLKCCLELKQNSVKLAMEVARRVIYFRVQNQIFITAFQKRKPMLGLETDGELLVDIKKAYPGIKTHLISAFPFNLPLVAEKYRPDMISFGWLDDSIISKLFFNLAIKPWVDLERDIKILREKGIKVLGGITNDPNAMLYFSRLGVDAIMTENAITAFALNLAKKRR